MLQYKDLTDLITQTGYLQWWKLRISLLWLQKLGTITLIIFFFFFFFFSFSFHYNPLWVLAFSVILFHSALSLHFFLHCLVLIICISSSISTIHLFLGLPLILVPICFHCNILLGVLLSSIRITWPSQTVLLLFINLTMSAFSISSYSSKFFLILQDPSSFWTGIIFNYTSLHFNYVITL